MRRLSAIFLPVPADVLVADFRLRHQPRAVARLLPPHVTILPPFQREVESDDALVADLTTHFAGITGFEAELTRVERFRRHVWLAPEPRPSFVGLIEETRRRFPALVGEEGREPVPHLTVAETGKGESTGAVAALAEEQLAPLLPFRFEVRDVGLWESRQDGWHEVRRFELG